MGQVCFTAISSNRACPTVFIALSSVFQGGRPWARAEGGGEWCAQFGQAAFRVGKHWYQS